MTCLQGLPGESLFSLKKTLRQEFVKLHLNEPHGFLINALWTDDTQAEMFGYDAMFGENQAQYCISE